MQLSYRGANYEQDVPSLEMTDSEITGKYRGQAVTYRYPRHIPVPQATPQLKYRGVTYCTNPRANAEAAFAAPAAEGTPDSVGSKPQKRQELMKQLEETHYRNICRRLEHRLEVARKRGDRDLLRMLEEEMRLVGYC